MQGLTNQQGEGRINAEVILEHLLIENERAAGRWERVCELD